MDTTYVWPRMKKIFLLLLILGHTWFTRRAFLTYLALIHRKSHRTWREEIFFKHFKTLADVLRVKWIVYISYTVVLCTSLAIHSQPILEPLARAIYGWSTCNLRAIYERSTRVLWMPACLTNAWRMPDECLTDDRQAFKDVQRAIYVCSTYARRKKLYVINRATSEHV